MYNRQLGAEEIVFLGEAWHEELSALSDQELSAACKTHMRTSLYFPSVAHILEAHKANKAAMPTKAYCLPYRELEDDERYATAARHLGKILSSLGSAKSVQ